MNVMDMNRQRELKPNGVIWFIKKLLIRDILWFLSLIYQAIIKGKIEA